MVAPIPLYGIARLLALGAAPKGYYAARVGARVGVLSAHSPGNASQAPHDRRSNTEFAASIDPAKPVIDIVLARTGNTARNGNLARQQRLSVGSELSYH